MRWVRDLRAASFFGPFDVSTASFTVERKVTDRKVTVLDWKPDKNPLQPWKQLADIKTIRLYDNNFIFCQL